MQSNNPIFNRSREFNSTNAGSFGNRTYAGNGGGFGSPASWGTGQPGDTQGYAPPGDTAPMTIDSVVQKTAFSLGVVVLFALGTWVVTPNLDQFATSADYGTIGAAATIGLLGAFVLSLVNSFKKVVSPALVLLFCALEGVGMGAISKIFDARFGDGVVSGAVIGTFAAFGGTLAAYKILNIQVGDKFRKGVMAAVFGMIGLAVMEMVLGAFGAQIGLFGVSGLGMLTAVAGLVLGVFMLILDFDFVEKGIANGLPERESWRAAFAMTVSLIWIYTNLLRILAFFSSD